MALGNKPLSADGFLGGAQIGYNFQSGSLVYGVEADISFSDIKDRSRTLSPVGYFDPFSYDQNYKMAWFGTARARVGAAFGNALLYVTGGLAAGEVKGLHFMQFPVTGYRATFSDMKVGWTIGAGLEYAVSRNWTIKGEYLYYDLGNTRSTANAVPAHSFQQAFTTSNKGHVVRIGVNYLFSSGGGAVVAKY